AAAAGGEWLAFLDSDDSWLPAKLERQLAALREHPDHPACYTEEVWYRRGAWANPRAVHAKHSGWIFRECLRLCLISPSSILLRRRLFEELGGFDESLPACEDYDLWLRLSARFPVLLVRERLIVKRNGHEGQLSQAHPALDRFRVRALWKIAFDGSLNAELRTLALESIVLRAGIVAHGAAKRAQTERERVFRYSQEAALRWIDRVQGS
ncbi:MAG: glycosyltransferase, partial [Deltaproteobacteria bacterium]|nr:glycosyltransferase [Deltaproteobacteria bacterium]